MDPDAASAAKEWIHWLKTFTNFIQAVEKTTPTVDKLVLLTNYVAPRVYDYISDCGTYNKAVEVLTSLYVKPKNEIFARHLLATRRQSSGESLDQFLQALKLLAKDCQFKSVTAEEACDSYVQDAFTNGLAFGAIRQQLLENVTLNLKTAYEQARTLEMAQKHSASYVTAEPITNAAVPSVSQVEELCNTETKTDPFSAAASSARCFFCGYNRHPRSQCPARDAVCLKCKKQGHYAKVCRSVKQSSSPSSSKHSAAMLAAIAGATPKCLEKSVRPLKINGCSLSALIDTGSSENFVCHNVVQENKLVMLPDHGNVSMADESLSSNILGQCTVDIELQEETYEGIKLKVLPSLCSDIILGHEFLQNHSALEMDFGGDRPPLKICGLAVVKVPAPFLFRNLTPECKPVAIRSRHYSMADKKFIEAEIGCMLSEGNIRPSNSPWRAQVLVTSGENHKKRLVIDYSQTINRFTDLDAYPLPNIDEMVNNIARYKVFSALDLKSAYHQVAIREDERQYTAFEAGGKLYEFNRIPFGVKNGVAAFQRVLDEILRKENVKGTFAYVDNVIVCGETEEEHEQNLKRFLKVAEE